MKVNKIGEENRNENQKEQESRNIFRFLIQMFCTFGSIVAVISVMTVLTGEGAKEYSTIFGLGGAGIPLSAVWQFLLLSFLYTAVIWLFYTFDIFPGVPETVRQILVIGCNGVLAIFFVILFRWFPAGLWEAWLGFILCFALCTAAAVGMRFLRVKTENRWYEENLRRYRERLEEKG